MELLLAVKKKWESSGFVGSMKERRKMFVDICEFLRRLLICRMILYLPVMKIDISKNLISQVLTIIVVILDDLIFRERKISFAIDWLAHEMTYDEQDAKKIKEKYYRYDERKENVCR